MPLQSDYNVDEKAPIDYSGGKNSLYADIPMMFVKHPDTKDIRPITDIRAIRQAVKNLVLTKTHERPFQPELGCRVTAYLFENVDQFTAIAIRDEIVRVLQLHEPRIKNVQVTVDLDADNNRLLVTILFQIKLTNETAEVEFYLDRIR